MKIRKKIILSIIVFAGLSSCTSKQAVVQKDKIENTAMVSTIGIPYFKAMGTEPFWNIEVSEKEIKFTKLGNEKGIVFPNEGFDTLYEDMKLSFTNKTHMLTLMATPGECSDGMSDKLFSHKVNVSLIDAESGEVEEYNGCGQFFVDPQLSKIWILKTLLDQDISAKDFSNEIPYIEFIGEKNIFSGFAGCNRINGKMQPNTDNRLQLIDIASTKMMCEPENKEEQFLKVLSKIGAYKFDGDTLILLDPTYVPLAIFTKR